MGVEPTKPRGGAPPCWACADISRGSSARSSAAFYGKLRNRAVSFRIESFCATAGHIVPVMMNPENGTKEGFLEKRSNGLLQLWKKKRCLLTQDGLRLYDWKDGDESAHGSKAKELRFEGMTTVDCVEYKRGLVYFTVVMAGGKEIDFRCLQEGTAWNAEIALALVRFKNHVAVQTGRTRHLSHLGSTGEEESLQA